MMKVSVVGVCGGGWVCERSANKNKEDFRSERYIGTYCYASSLIFATLNRIQVSVKVEFSSKL